MGRRVDMTSVRLAYVHEYRDRHGRIRRYFRRRGYKKVMLPGLPGSSEFMEAYRAALGGNRVEGAGKAWQRHLVRSCGSLLSVD